MSTCTVPLARSLSAEPSTRDISNVVGTSGPSARCAENHAAVSSRSRSVSFTPPSWPAACQTTLSGVSGCACAICSAVAFTCASGNRESAWPPPSRVGTSMRSAMLPGDERRMSSAASADTVPRVAASV